MITRKLLYDLYTVTFFTYQEKLCNLITNGGDQLNSINSEGRKGARQRGRMIPLVRLGSSCVR